MENVDHDGGTAKDHISDLLMSVCVPSLYSSNAFRIIGLNVDAPTRDVKRRIDEIKDAEELGHGANEHQHAFAIKPPPSLDSIKDAAQKLQEPERRMLDEFFWFWPAKWGDSKNDEALSGLKRGDKSAAVSAWTAAAQKGDATAKHNLAVVYHLIALDGERIAKRRKLTPEELTAIKKYWLRSFQWWDAVLEDDSVWDLVKDRIRSIDDPRLTTGFARRLKGNLPKAFDQINAMLAIEFAESGRMDLAELHIEYMKASNPGKDDVQGSLQSVCTPILKRIKQATEVALDRSKQHPDEGPAQAAELLSDVQKPLDILRRFIGVEDDDVLHAQDIVAEAVLDCLIPFYRENNDWEEGVESLSYAVDLAASDELKKRLNTNLTTVKNNGLRAKYAEPIYEQLEKIDNGNLDSAGQVKAIERDVLPAVERMRMALGVKTEICSKCCDAVASLLRNLAVDLYNKDSNLQESKRVLAIATRLASGKDIVARLAEDKKALEGIERDEALAAEEMKRRAEALAQQRRSDLTKRWGWGIAILVGIIWIANSGGPSKPAAWTEERPPVGSGQVLSYNQIRYCVAEDIRIGAMQRSLNSYVSSQVDLFNYYVGDYNSRCSNFKYRSGSLESIRSAANARRSTLEYEGMARLN